MTFATMFLAPPDGTRVLLPAIGIEQRILVGASTAGGQLAMLEETTQPGKGPPLHIHHRQTEIFRFLEGEYELVVGERRYVATAGAAAVVPPGTVHAFRNIGPTPARLLFILTPALGGEAFFTELAAAMAQGKPDEAVLRELAQRHGTEIVGPPLGA